MTIQTADLSLSFHTSHEKVKAVRCQKLQNFLKFTKDLSDSACRLDISEVLDDGEDLPK